MKIFLRSLLLLSPALSHSATEQAPPPAPPIVHQEAAEAPFKPAFTAQTTLYSIGTPTDEEQLYLELINRARANPTAEGNMLAASTHPNVQSSITQFSVDLDLMKTEFAALPVRPPLAMNRLLTNAARGHSQYLLDNAVQDHDQVGGITPSDRVTAAGYVFTTVGESIFSFAKDVFHAHAGFQIDWGPGGTGGMQLGRGHRMNNHGDFREVGVGVIFGTNTLNGKTVGPQLVTQNFASSNAGHAFVTGVAYYDRNGNDLYDLGEGIGGLTVNVDGSTFHAVTASSGGYTVPVPTADATRAVTFTGLGATGGGDAVIAGGANVKVDFKPAYNAPELTGPDSASISGSADYTFDAVIGATGYKRRHVANVNAANDAADNTTRVSVVKTGTYAIISTAVKDAGSGCYRLVHPTFVDQNITYQSSFHVKTGGSLSFRSRLGWAGPEQFAKVEVSTDGGTAWTSVYTQAGTGTSGETSFNTRTVSLAAFAGKEIRLRFNYTVGGAGFAQTDNGVGWYIDTVSFTNLVDLSGATTTTLPASTTVAFTPPAVGDFLLSVSPIISGRDFGFGPAKVVTGVDGDPPTIDTPPTSLVVAEGNTATFSVAASHPTLGVTYQWRKNNVAIKNATLEDFTIQLAKAADAASYTVVVTAGSKTATSTPVTLAVVKPVSQLLVVADGTSLKPAITLTGTADLEWTKTHGDPATTDPLVGETLKTLTLNKLSAATGSGVYKCTATAPGGNSLPAGTFDIRVFSAKPQVTQVQNLPGGDIGSPYVHQILLDGGLDESPTAFAAKNLPTGLFLNTKTGLITGVPTVAKTFKVTVSATNSKGSTSSQEQDVIINPLPGGVAGTFTGIVARDPILNADLGGRVDMAISSGGAISGSFTLGTLKLPFKSTIVIDNEAPIDPPTAFINVTRGAGKTPYSFVLTLDPANDRFAPGTAINDGPNSADVEGWRHVWSTLNLATVAPKLFTYALRPPAAPAEMPRGDGYGSFTLAKDGKLTAAGKLADGESYTSATYAGPHGQILIFQPLYTAKGSLLGRLDIDAGDDGLLDDDGLTGTVSWTRPANAKSRLYPAGFGPVDLTAVGARFTTPVNTALILDIAVGVDKASLTFAEGGIAGSVTNANVDEFEILKGNKAQLPAALSSGNPGSVKITTLNAATGLFSGSFILEDDELRTGTAFAGKKIKRTGAFNGILTHDGTAKIGAGYFHLPELPQDADPAAVPPQPATTPTTSLILSGSVLMEKK